jgi:ketosteroid isomerase-like protein
MTTATDAATAEVLRVEESFFAALLAAVVVGRTRMTMRFLDSESTVESRYTHVYAHDADGWRLLSAQGTPIVDPPTAQ